jgi:hypothetical protein
MRILLLAAALLVTSWLASPEPSCAQGNCLEGFSCFNDFACGQGCQCIKINGPGQNGVCG